MSADGVSHQPYLHELVTVVAAPALVLSGPDGQLTGTGATGVFLGDRRVLSRLVVTVDGRLPAAVAGDSTGTGTARFVGVVRHLGDPGPDPTVVLERDRSVRPTGAVETVRLVSRARTAVRCTVTVELAADLADIEDVKSGRPSRHPVPPAEVSGVGVRWPRGTVVEFSTAPRLDLRRGCWRPGTSRSRRGGTGRWSWW